MTFNHGLSPGIIINNEQLCNIFKCSPQGGMRKSNVTNTLVIVSDHTDGFYDDRWINGVFHYTGMGRTGDQSLTFMQNRTLNESNHNSVEVYLFEVFKSGQYTFIGQVYLSEKPYAEEQLDDRKQLRKVWVFPVKLVDETQQVKLPIETINELRDKHEKQAKKLTDAELRNRALRAGRGRSQRQTTVTTYERDEFVSEYARRRANGKCQLCELNAPFNKKNGDPYLETHHIEWLSRGGEDSILNTVALCPNCHKKMHIVDNQNDVQILKQKAQQLVGELV